MYSAVLHHLSLPVGDSVSWARVKRETDESPINGSRERITEFGLFRHAFFHCFHCMLHDSPATLRFAVLIDHVYMAGVKRSKISYTERLWIHASGE